METVFALTGANKGKTGVWGGFNFVDGFCKCKLSGAVLESVAFNLKRYHAVEIVTPGEDTHNRKFGKGQLILSIVKNLDPNDDSLWTSSGLPGVSVVAGVSPSLEGITRAEISDATEQYDRHKALFERSGE